MLGSGERLVAEAAKAYRLYKTQRKKFFWGTLHMVPFDSLHLQLTSTSKVG